MICEKCHKNEGETYQFYFGKTILPGKEKNNDVTYPSNYAKRLCRYKLGGSEKVIICDSCIEKYRKQGIIILLISSLLTLPLITQMIDAYRYVWIIIILFWVLIFSFAEGLIRLLKNKDDIGSEFGIKLNHQKIIKEGYDILWNLSEYKNLLLKEKIEKGL